MKPQIDNNLTRVTLSFTPSEYILVNSKNEWTLNNLIDRSEKGKSPDIGLAIVHLDDNDVEIFKNAGFSYVHLNID